MPKPLLKEIQIWYRKLCKLMMMSGLDIYSPMSCMRLRCFDMLNSFAGGMPTTFSMEKYCGKLGPEGSYLFPEPTDPSGYGKWLTSGNRSLAEMTNEQITQMYNYCRKGQLLLASEDNNFLNSRQIYQNDRGELKLSCTAYNAPVYTDFLADAQRDEDDPKKVNKNIKIGCIPDDATYQQAGRTAKKWDEKIFPVYGRTLKSKGLYANTKNGALYAKNLSEYCTSRTRAFFNAPGFTQDDYEEYQQRFASTNIYRNDVTFNPVYYATEELSSERLNMIDNDEDESVLAGTLMCYSLAGMGIRFSEAVRRGMIVNGQGQPYAHGEKPWSAEQEIIKDRQAGKEVFFLARDGENNVVRCPLSQEDFEFHGLIKADKEMTVNAIVQKEAEEKTEKLINREIHDAAAALRNFATQAGKNILADEDGAKKRILAVLFAAATLRDAYRRTNDPYRAANFAYILKNFRSVVQDTEKSQGFAAFVSTVSTEAITSGTATAEQTGEFIRNEYKRYTDFIANPKLYKEAGEKVKSGENQPIIN